MSKRGAERTLTKDDVEAGEDEETVTEKGVFAEASEEQLSKRKFVTAKRKTTASANTGTALPKFNFGAVPTSSDNKEEEKKAEPAAAAPAAAATPAAAPVVNNAFAKFMLQAGSWECPSCEVQNKKEDAKCKACETPNPNASGDASSSSAALAASGFTFGVQAGSEPATTTTPATNGTPFSFGSGTSFASTFSTPFTFGAPSSSSSATPVVTFGSIQSAGDSGFGSGGTLEFASATDTGLVTSGEIDAQFKDKTREASGDEKDKTIHVQKDTVVYQMKPVPKKKPSDTKDPTAAATAAAEAAAKPDEKVEMETKYVEIGKGDLKINVFDKEDGKKGARMLLRANQTQRLVLNAPLFDQFIVSIQNDKFIRFHSLDIDLKLATFLIKYKTKTEASDVMNAITKALDAIGAKAAPTSTTTSSSSSATSKPATTDTPAS